MDPIVKATVRNGKLHFENRARFDEYARSLEGEVEVIVRRKHYGRSLNQNAYYHGVVVALLSEWSGHEPSEIHEQMKKKFLDGQSTTRLSTKEFTRFIESCRQFGAENGVLIPDPGEVDLAEPAVP